MRYLAGLGWASAGVAMLFWAARANRNREVEIERLVGMTRDSPLFRRLYQFRGRANVVGLRAFGLLFCIQALAVASGH